MLSEKELVEKLKSGDKRAFETLFIEYKDIVYTIVCRMIYNKNQIEDITSDILLKIYKNIRQFDERAKLSTWIYRVAYNHCVDYITKLKRNPLEAYKPLDAMFSLSSSSPNPEEASLKSEKDKVLYALVDSMPERYRMVINFYYLEETSYKDISEIMGIPIGTVKTYLFRAKVYLKKKMQEMGFYERM